MPPKTSSGLEYKADPFKSCIGYLREAIIPCTRATRARIMLMLLLYVFYIQTRCIEANWNLDTVGRLRSYLLQCAPQITDIMREVYFLQHINTRYDISRYTRVLLNRLYVCLEWTLCAFIGAYNFTCSLVGNIFPGVLFP